MKITSILQKNAMAIVAMATIVGFSAFKIGSEAIQTTATFVYQAPSSDPYAENNVKNTSNWIRSTESCSLDEAQDVACSIEVPLNRTMNGGNQIDPSQVTIETFQHSANNYGVSPSTSGHYEEPVNKPLTQ